MKNHDYKRIHIMASDKLKIFKPIKKNLFASHSWARDDKFEDISADMNNLAMLDVLANDLGGRHRKLWSLDDGDNLEDLRQKDEVNDINLSQRGAHIWITDDGKVAYALSPALQDEVKRLKEGEFLEDSFVYTTRQGVGPLHWATATVKINGVNDAPELAGTQALLSAGEANKPYTILAADLLTGYTDPENDPLSVIGISASHGTLTEIAGGWLLTPETGYSGPVILNYQITDGQGGNTEATLGFDLLPLDDDFPLVLTSSFPWDDFEGFEVDYNIELAFNEPVKAGQGSIIISNGSDERVIDVTDVNQVTFLTDSGKSGSTGRVIIDPTDDLIADTTYHIRLDSGVITDLAGKPYAGILDDTTLNFSTISSEPLLQWTNLWDGQSGFKADNDIQLFFDEPVQAGQGEIIISNGSDTRIIDINDASQVSFDLWGGVIINPTENLKVGTDYHIRISEGAIVDLNGNPYAGIDDETTLNFTTSSIYPLLIYSNPGDEQSDFKADNDIQLFFDEPVQAGQGEIIISNGSDTRIIDINDASQVSFDLWGGVIINPTENLEVGTDYHIRISEGAIVDLNGNPYAGIDDETTLNFVTVTSDPLLISSNPQDNAADFQLDSDITLHFDEQIQAGQGSIVLSNGSDTRVIDIQDSSQVSFNHGKVILNPAEDLIADTDYHIQITEGAIIDLAGNPYAGISDETTLNFRVISSNPFLTGSNPLDDAEAFSANSDIHLYFNEEVQPGSGEIILSNGTDIRVIDINDASQVTFDQGKVVINPLDDLVADTSYHIRISENAIVDLAGNPYAGIHDDTTLNFAVTEPFSVNIIGESESELLIQPAIWTI